MKEVTCFMLYYGRKAVAEESLESFLRQTYPHKKLLIVNTHPDKVWFQGVHRSVEVHNMNDSDFENLNDKYNYALSQITTSWWCPWDSDDIWLPWHLENLMTANVEGNGLPKRIGLSHSYVMMNNGKETKKIGIKEAMAGGSVWETFDESGQRYPFVDFRRTDYWDRQIIDQGWDEHWMETSLSFIFRWYQDPQYKMRTDVFHRSKIGGGNTGIEYEKRLRTFMNKLRIKSPWRPHWKEDYIDKVRLAENTETYKVFYPCKM